jgi:hypothetical protein
MGGQHKAGPFSVENGEESVGMASTAARVEVAISSTEYDLTLAKDLADRLTSRLSAASKNAIQIGAAADVATSKTKDEGAIWTKARIVVVLHDRLWGKTPATTIAATSLAARKAKGSSKTIKVIRLDDTALQSCLRGADAKPMAQGLDALADWIAAGVSAAGGSLRKSKKISADDVRRAEVAATFLGSSRAVAICAREFERLADGIAKRAVTLGEKAGSKAEVQRMPDRCIVQMGPVALSVSWVRERVDTVATGRLMIAEWNGTVVRSPLPTAPVTATQTVAPRPATLVREHILRADATGEPDWVWRREPTVDVAYPSRELAAKCVDSLLLSLQESST